MKETNSSSNREFDDEKGSESEIEDSSSDSEESQDSIEARWTPNPSLSRTLEILIHLREHFGHLYESFSLWWLSLAISLPQILHSLYHIVFLSGSFIIPSSETLLRKEIGDSFQSLSTLLRLWKPVLMSQATEYLGNSEEAWVDRKDSAYEALLQRTITPMWQKVFLLMEATQISSRSYLIIWEMWKAFYREQRTLLSMDTLKILNESISTRLSYLVHQWTTTEFGSESEEPRMDVRLLVPVWLKQFISHSQVNYFGDLLFAIFRGMQRDWITATSVKGPVASEIEISVFLHREMKGWGHLFEPSAHMRWQQFYLEEAHESFNLHGGSSFRAPEDTFQMLCRLAQSGYLDGEVWLYYLEHTFFPSWLKQLRGKLLVLSRLVDSEKITSSHASQILLEWYQAWQICFVPEIRQRSVVYLNLHSALLLLNEFLQSL